MTWNYRVFKVIPKKLKSKPKILQPKPYYCIKEIFYNGKTLWTKDPIWASGDTKKELIESLELMLKDAKRYRTKIEVII